MKWEHTIIKKRQLEFPSSMKSILVEIRKSVGGLNSSTNSAKEQTGELGDQTDAREHPKGIKIIKQKKTSEEIRCTEVEIPIYA